MQLLCELQRDWARKETVPAFMNIAIETGSTFGIHMLPSNPSVQPTAAKEWR